MAEKLTEEEIEKVLKKIKSKYDEYSKLFGKKIFNYDLFKERYLAYLKTRGIMDVFLFAEIEALEERKNEIDEKIAKRKRVREIQEDMKNRGNELLEKIASYPEDNFHCDGRLEIKKLIAVLKVIYEPLQKYYYDIHGEDHGLYQKALGTLKDFMMQPYSGIFAKYYRELMRPIQDPKKLELIEQQLIKEYGIAMNTFISILLKIRNHKELPEFINILKKINEDFRLTIFNAFN